MKKNYLLIKDGEIQARVSNVELSKVYKESEEADGVEFREVPDNLKDDILDLELDGGKLKINQVKKSKRISTENKPSMQEMIEALILNDSAKLDDYKTRLQEAAK